METFMAEGRPPVPAVAERPASDRLETWGEIAVYLNREIRTVQRWEKTMGLPIRRLGGGPDKQSRVFALKSELDVWWHEHEVLRNAPEPHDETSGSNLATVVAPPSPSEKERAVRRRLLQWSILIAATALLTVFIPKIAERIWPSKVVLAVPPFRNLGEKADDYIAAGLTEEMIARLGQLHPDLMSVQPVNTGVTTVRGGGRATHFLLGTVRRVNDQVAVTAQLIDSRNQTVVWGNTYERDVKDLLRVQAEVAEAIASEVFRKLPHPAAPAREVNREAYLSYLEGRYFWNRRTAESIQKAVTLFERSINEDATYAPAYAGLADCYELLGSAPYTTMPPREAYPKAEVAARKAMELDESLAEAHVSLGYAYLAYEWKFTDADREFRRALDLRPSYATGHQYYAYSLTAAGKLREAIEERKKAVDLDPVSPLMASALGEAYYQARQFDQTIEQNQRALELDPRYAIALVNIGRAYQQKGMHPQAQAAFQKILAVVPDDPAVLSLLGHEYAVSGQRDEALRTLAKLKNLAAQRYVPAIYFALIYTGLGDRNEAFRGMEAAVNERTEYLVYLGSEPLADPLRDDPRFADLLKEVGISAKPGSRISANSAPAGQGETDSHR
jgi:tetratricopeptide (TPR) repeat protein